MDKRYKHIELFAGCGGMSLGLDAAGFDLYFANELSPMAGETFAFNILDEDLNKKAEQGEVAGKVKWINSNFAENDLSSRLRENPFLAKNGPFSDISTLQDIKGKLLIGDIDDLLIFLNGKPDIVQQIREDSIDLLSGGPPCQSFSLAGRRQKNDHKNQLPLSFAKIAGLIRPKVVLLENVKGITSPFIEEGNKYYAWLEVSKAFVLEGFVPVCMMLNSKYFGVAQNRPRFILFAFRHDVFLELLNKYKSNVLLEFSAQFYQKVVENKDKLEEITVKDFSYTDIESAPELFDGVILPKIRNNQGQFVSANEAIGDIRRTNITYSGSKVTRGYGHNLNETFKYKKSGDFEIKNHDPRKHTFDVKARFRFYQVINEFQNGLKKGAVDLFTGKPVSAETSEKLMAEFQNYSLYFKQNGDEVYKIPRNIEEVKKLVESIPTKKHSQRALFEYEPAPAQLTIPDDICHYHMETLRTMTVREMARFQSFPDWFEFRSKVTTGGESRKFEVPQYTQVGNAVPPLLALQLGEVVYSLLTE
ncbi:DNA cytosine methyltransferase [Olivibacter jilunii]|uniref:DNA cytosine methyltransferase n=1 Tax=Olivibacter jilunii TaxID=985016 RepID=UPI003F15C72D